MLLRRVALPSAAAVLLVVALVCAQDGPSDGATPSAEASAGPGQRFEKIGENLYRIGSVLLDARKRTIQCPGEVNMAEGGPIELLACTEKGKVHESVFILHVAPMDLQVALLLLSLEPGRNPAARYWEDDPDGRKPPGDTVRISVGWRPEGASKEEALRTEPAEHFLYNVQTDTPLATADWVFMGSTLSGGRFAAEAEGTIITTFHDPVAVLELNHETVNDDIYYSVNKKLCPKVGTAVELVIRAEPKAAGEAKPGDDPPEAH